MDSGECILVLGGARAGKSTFALQLAQDRETAPGYVCFIATAEASDDEMQMRIDRHRAERPDHWQTIEETKHLDIALQKAHKEAVVVIDCLTLWVSNWMLSDENRDQVEQNVMDHTTRFLATVANTSQTVVMVSNEVGLGLVPATPLGRDFRDILGRVNQRVAQAATQVYLMVAGLPMPLKSGQSLVSSGETT